MAMDMDITNVALKGKDFTKGQVRWTGMLLNEFIHSYYDSVEELARDAEYAMAVCESEYDFAGLRRAVDASKDFARALVQIRAASHLLNEARNLTAYRKSIFTDITDKARPKTKEERS